VADAEDADLLIAAAREAGALAMTFFRGPLRSWPKGVDSVVSEADIAVDELLGRRLRAARPEYGWLSEETADSEERLSRRRVFVVDPIDGTRAYIAGREEWTVSLAVVEAGRPVAAALHAPVLEEMFSAVAGQGAWRNGAALHVPFRDGLSGVRIAGPLRHARALAKAAGVPADSVRFVPSLAYRLALVAADAVDVALASSGAHDWDLAASDLLVHEAGGRLVDRDGGMLHYNGERPVHGGLVAAHPALVPAVLALLAGSDRNRRESAS
jgi:myo-inositol-1(or 4)-monophosphatase